MKKTIEIQKVEKVEIFLNKDEHQSFNIFFNREGNEDCVGYKFTSDDTLRLARTFSRLATEFYSAYDRHFLQEDAV